MNIIIIDKSGLSSVRLGNIITSIGNVENIVQILDVKNILDIVEKTNPDVIIWDLNINGQVCFELMKKVLKLMPSVCIIALTSYSIEQYRKKCREIGVRHCLDKTTEFENIIDIISSKQGDLNKKKGAVEI